MLNLPRWRVILCVAAMVFGLVFTLPNLLPAKVAADLPGWVPHQRLNLGLDLQGGTHLVMTVDVEKALENALDHNIDELKRELTDGKVPVDTLAAAQSRLVETLYQYNQSKLQLARNTGVVESQYKVYLGR